MAKANGRVKIHRKILLANLTAAQFKFFVGAILLAKSPKSKDSGIVDLSVRELGRELGMDPSDIWRRERELVAKEMLTLLPKGFRIVNYHHYQTGKVLTIDNSLGDAGVDNSQRSVDNSQRSVGSLKAKTDNKKYKTIKKPPIVPQTTAFSVWESAVGRPITGWEGEQLGAAIDDFTEEWVKDAISEAAKNGKLKVNLGYISTILERWKVEGRSKKQSKKEGDKWNMRLQPQ